MLCSLSEACLCSSHCLLYLLACKRDLCTSHPAGSATQLYIVSMCLCWHGSTLHFGWSLHAAANSSADAAAAPHLYVLQLTGMTPALDETAFCAGKPCAGFTPLCWQGSALLHPRTTRTSSAQASLHLTCGQRRSALKQLRGQALFACLLTARGAGLLLLSSIVTPHLLAVLVRGCPVWCGDAGLCAPQFAFADERS